MQIIKVIFKGFGLTAAAGTSLLLFDVHQKNRCDQHSFRTAVKHYITVRGLAYVGRRMHKKLEEDSQNIKQVQEELLMKRISQTKDTIYGKDHSFSDITSREDFVKIHPLTRYEHYRPYIERVAKGEENVLSKDKPTVLAMTSGTSGRSNMVPMLKQQSSTFFINGIAVIYDLMISAFPNLKYLQKDLKFFYSARWRDSEAGIPVGPNSSSPKNSSGALHIYSTPLPAYDVLDEPEALYLHLLFGLKDKNIGILESNFASLIYNGFYSLEQNWPQLTQDIENGSVSDKLAINEDIRKKLNALMKPDASRAAELREEFEKGFEGIAKRIWPHCNLLLTVATGSFELYGEYLTNKFCKGIPVYSPLYGATEGLIGININPLSERRDYMLVPRAMFFEFIPIEHAEEEQPKTLFIDQVEKGETYELVITNLSCLFRYRFGDVVRISGFHNQSPQVEFLYRQGQLLNLRGEKTSERTMYKALQEAVSAWKEEQLVDYCCVESFIMDDVTGSKSKYPQYNLFIELEKGASIGNDEKSLIDSSLRKESYVYGSFRRKNSIGPIRVHEVKKGTFRKLKGLMLDKTDATSNQFKVPRVLRRQDAVQLMLENTV